MGSWERERNTDDRWVFGLVLCLVIAMISLSLLLWKTLPDAKVPSPVVPPGRTEAAPADTSGDESLRMATQAISPLAFRLTGIRPDAVPTHTGPADYDQRDRVVWFSRHQGLVHESPEALAWYIRRLPRDAVVVLGFVDEQGITRPVDREFLRDFLWLESVAARPAR